MVVPNGPCAARSGSVWIHWWSPVASANVLIRSCDTSNQSLSPTWLPIAALSSSSESNAMAKSYL